MSGDEESPAAPGGHNSTHEDNEADDPFSLIASWLSLINRDHEDDRDLQFRVWPITGTYQMFNLPPGAIGAALVDFIGHGELSAEQIEYRWDDEGAWLDASTEGEPVLRGKPQLSPQQVADLVSDNEHLQDVPYGEPLVFLAEADVCDSFWERAVAAGWAPSFQALELMMEARMMLGAQDYDAWPGTTPDYAPIDDGPFGPVARPPLCTLEYRHPELHGLMAAYSLSATPGALYAAREAVGAGALEVRCTNSGACIHNGEWTRVQDPPRPYWPKMI